MMFSENPKPVYVGQELTLTIIDVSGRGDGVARVDGFVVFVKGSGFHPNTPVKAKIVQVRAHHAIAEQVTS